MIDAVYLGGIQLDNDKRFLRSIKNLAYPNVDFSSTKKGGFEGQAITPSKFSGYRIQTEWVITGSSFSDLATQRQNFVELLGSIISQGPQIFKIDKANGIDVQATVKTADVLSDVSDPDPLNSPMMIEMQSEFPFLVSDVLKSETVYIFSGGGMAVPMIIPLDMSSGGLNEAIIDNDGNYPSYPVLRFCGPLTNPTLTNITTGKTLSLTYTLTTASDIIEVDVFLRTAKFIPSGVNARRYVSGDFWTIATGSNVIHLGSSNINAIGKCIIEYRDTFLGI